MATHRSRAGRVLLLALPLAGVLCAAAAPVALAGPTVTVRVEGEHATLLPATTVTLGSPEPVSGCAADSVAAAINLAVGGNWDHGEANSGGGDFTETILGETHDFSHEADTWAEWVDYKWGGGICSDTLSEGDEVVMIADHEPEPWYTPTVLPLVLGGVPRVVQAGVPFTVSVDAVHTPAGAFAEPGEGTPEPQAGVTVTAGGASAMTGAGGLATLTLTQPGTFALRAAGAGDAPSRSFSVCVHNGNDGNCGTTAAVPAPPTAVPAPAVQAPPRPYTGPYAIVARPLEIADSQVFAPGRAPRLIEGEVLAHSSVTSVEIELRRSLRGRCWYFDGTRERFVHARCGAGEFFHVGSGASFSYLLPAALPAGRYVLDIRAGDSAGNLTSLDRGTTRTVFRVR